MTRPAGAGHEHFSEEDWVAFARGRGDPAHRARVARHLETGCPECERTLRLWAALLSVADQDAPAPKGLGEWLGAGVALVFDSFRQPQAAGVRASMGSRHLLYKAGRYTIKVQVEPGADSRQLSIMGQILDEQDRGGGLRDIAVLALRGSKTLDRTLTNRLGEFHLEADDAAGALQLSVGVPEIGTFAVHTPSGTEGTVRDASTDGERAQPRPRG